MSPKKLIDYYKSCPVQCKTGVYADSSDGTRLYYYEESADYKPDIRSGKKTKVKKKLMRPLYSYLVLAMCQHATMLKRAAYTNRSKADEKTQFRAWLHQIGLSGKKYKGVRKQLMKNFKFERTERRMVA